jgi:hypothetical protein
MCFCEFCGFAQCKNCLQQTRYFFEDSKSRRPGSPVAKLDDGGDFFASIKNKIFEDEVKRPRGKVCIVCQRKFLLNKELAGSFKAINA